MEIIYIFVSIFIVSLVSLVGLFAFYLRHDLMKKVLFVLVGLAAGTLIGGAVIHLIPESLEHIGDANVFALALLSGFVGFFVLEKYLRWHHAHHGPEEEHIEEEAHHHPKHLGPMVLVADGIHNLLDGAIIAASFLISPVLGVATTIAVFLHEIPQEVADYALLVHSGFSRVKALAYNFLSALMAFVGALFVLFLHEAFASLEALVVAFTAGAFIYIAAADLMPELQKTREIKRGFMELLAIVVGIALMFSLTFFEVGH